jgi:hypothetical protein
MGGVVPWCSTAKGCPAPQCSRKSEGVGLGSPAPLTTSGFQTPSFFAHIVGGWGRQGPSSHSCPSLSSTFSVSGRSFWGRALHPLSSARKRERREQEGKREEGRSASQLTTWRASGFVGASATQVPACYPKPGDGSGMDMSEPEQLSSVASGSRVCVWEAPYLC